MTALTRLQFFIEQLGGAPLRGDESEWTPADYLAHITGSPAQGHVMTAFTARLALVMALELFAENDRLRQLVLAPREANPEPAPGRIVAYTSGLGQPLPAVIVFAHGDRACDLVVFNHPRAGQPSVAMERVAFSADAQPRSWCWPAHKISQGCEKGVARELVSDRAATPSPTEASA